MSDRRSNGHDDLYERLLEAEPEFVAHHQVHYASSALDMAALLSQRHPYLKGDAYETAIDLLDEAGAATRIRRLAKGSGEYEVLLPDIAAVASKKTGLSIEELLREASE